MKPVVGDIVYYYTDLFGALPMAAIVTTVYSEDIVNLMVTDGDRWFSKKSIHWKDCKSVRENPTIAKQCGAWGYKVEPVTAETLEERAAEARKRGPGGKFQPKSKIEEPEEELSPI